MENSKFNLIISIRFKWNRNYKRQQRFIISFFQRIILCKQKNSFQTSTDSISSKMQRMHCPWFPPWNTYRCNVARSVQVINNTNKALPSFYLSLIQALLTISTTFQLVFVSNSTNLTPSQHIVRQTHNQRTRESNAIVCISQRI